MGVCLSGTCGCPDWIILLAFLGGALLYFLVGLLTYLIIKSFKEDLDEFQVVLLIVFWPLVLVMGIVGAIVYYVGGYLCRLLILPIIGVDKYQLKESEDKIIKKVESGDDKIMDYLKYEYKPSKVKSKEVVKAVKEKPIKKVVKKKGKK